MQGYRGDEPLVVPRRVSIPRAEGYDLIRVGGAIARTRPVPWTPRHGGRGRGGGEGHLYLMPPVGARLEWTRFSAWGTARGLGLEGGPSRVSFPHTRRKLLDLFASAVLSLTCI